MTSQETLFGQVDKADKAGCQLVELGSLLRITRMSSYDQ